LMMGGSYIVVHRGLDDKGVKRSNSKSSVASVISSISSIFGSQQSINRPKSRERFVISGI
uniref:Pecanex-like protein n=1 Tax=Anisakis simplex TaxID=6269 RepID=A0A0M3JAN7_ANISI